MLHRLISQLVSSFLLLTIVRKYRNRASLLKIKAARLYVLGVKKTRFFFLGALFVLLSFVFLINGLSLVQTAFFTYSMWSNETKFMVSLILGTLEFIGAVSVLYYLFREETWTQFTEIHQVVSSAVDHEGKNIQR